MCSNQGERYCGKERRVTKRAGSEPVEPERVAAEPDRRHVRPHRHGPHGRLLRHITVSILCFDLYSGHLYHNDEFSLLYHCGAENNIRGPAVPVILRKY